MVRKKLLAVASVACLSAILAGCSSGSNQPKSSTPVAGSTSVTSASASTAPPPSTTTSPATRNLVVTDAVRAALLQAGAALKGLPVSDFTGLVPGMTYYAYDAATATYWAGASLLPSSSSLQAQVSSQDDGAYLLFSMPAGGVWTAVNDGLGARPGSGCPAPVPAAILALWQWPAGTCNPPPPTG
jgi:hypothetical protein